MKKSQKDTNQKPSLNKQNKYNYSDPTSPDDILLIEKLIDCEEVNI